MFLSTLILAAFFSSGPPDPHALVQGAIAASNAQEEQGWKYTHSVERTDYKIDKTGQSSITHTKLYDVVMLEGAEYTKLIQVDGKAPDPKLQKKIDDDLERERENRKKKRNIGLHIERSMKLSTLADLERLYDNRVTGEEVVEDRAAWRMESEPKSGHSAVGKRDEELSSQRQTTWFDEKEGAILQTRTEIIRPVNGLLPGTVIEDRYAKVGDAWLLADLDFQADMKVGLLLFRMRTHYRHFNYKRFTVETRITGS